jgi:TM2 domain-containing membrane protein YozV
MKFPLIFLFFIFCLTSKAGTFSLADVKSHSTFSSDTNSIDSLQKEKSHHKLFTGKKENKKLIAAILAFPIPFGFLGLHRIYLGTDPWVPVVYLVTAGGGMLLPFIDFIAILCADKEQLKAYENNPRLFMWVN